MRKLFVLSLAILLVAGVAFADSIPQPSNPNVVYLGGHKEMTAVPETEVRLVRYSLQEANAPSLASGDVVVWSTTSHDGITVTACTGTSLAPFAGVLVTTLATADNGRVDVRDNNWGYIAVKGYCLAKVDTSNATTGLSLVLNGATLEKTLGTQDKVFLSDDVGVLLLDTGSDGLMEVILQ